MKVEVSTPKTPMIERRGRANPHNSLEIDHEEEIGKEILASLQNRYFPAKSLRAQH